MFICFKKIKNVTFCNLVRFYYILKHFFFLNNIKIEKKIFYLKLTLRNRNLRQGSLRKFTFKSNNLHRDIKGDTGLLVHAVYYCPCGRPKSKPAGLITGLSVLGKHTLWVWFSPLVLLTRFCRPKLQTKNCFLLNPVTLGVWTKAVTGGGGCPNVRIAPEIFLSVEQIFNYTRGPKRYPILVKRTNYSV